MGFAFEVWLSLVERYVRDVEAASSNLVTSIERGGRRNRCCGNLRLLMKIRPFEPDFSCFSNDFRKITELSARYLKTLTE